MPPGEAMEMAAADAVAAALLAGLKPEVRAALVRAVSAGAATTAIFTRGRLRCSPGFEDVRLGDTHYDLRERKKARLCIQYLVEAEAFEAASARHFLDEIDPYVRQKGDFPRLSEIKIGDYFNDPRGKLRRLRQELIRSTGDDGRYFLNVE